MSGIKAGTADRNSRVWIRFLFIWIAGAWVGAPPSARAVILHGTGDPVANVTAPAGSLTNSGWESQGYWGAYLGTAIAPHYFITARHVGGTVGDPFHINGATFITTRFYDDLATDLRICRTSGVLPSFHSVNATTNEVGKSMVVLGRGTQRGEPVITRTTNFFGQVTEKTHGWTWGTMDGVRRWGQNAVEGVVDGNAAAGGSGIGELLRCGFNAGAGTNECHLSTGDSGGALFVQEGSAWKLAGIHYGSAGIYNTSAAGPGFFAAVFDEGGLYQQAGTNWVFRPDFALNQAGSFYSTRISSRIEWINSVINGSADDELGLQSSGAATGPFADMEASIDLDQQAISTPLPAGPRFFRIRSATQNVEITSITIRGNELVLSYE